MPSMQFAVQPPTKSQMGSTLYPPVVISVPVTNYIKSGTAVPEIFQGFLQDSSGNVVEHSGPYIASPQPLSSASPNSGTEDEYVVFPDIAINLPGKYTFAVRYYDPSDTQSWSVMGELETQPFTITEGAVSHKAPGMFGPAESKVLGQLAASGNFGL